MEGLRRSVHNLTVAKLKCIWNKYKNEGTGKIATISHKIFETNSSFRIKWHTTGKV